MDAESSGKPGERIAKALNVVRERERATPGQNLATLFWRCLPFCVHDAYLRLFRAPCSFPSSDLDQQQRNSKETKVSMCAFTTTTTTTNTTSITYALQRVCVVACREQLQVSSQQYRIDAGLAGTCACCRLMYAHWIVYISSECVCLCVSQS